MNKLQQNLITLIFSLFSSLFIAGCFSKPDFSFTPEISNARIVRIPIGTPLTPQDSLILTIDFKDGNGDLGLFAEERIRADTLAGLPASPYQQFFYTKDSAGNDIDSTANPFHFNYFLKVYRQEDGAFNEIIFPDGVTFNGGFQPLFEDNNENERPLEGELNFRFKILPISFSAFDTLKFEIQIADRANNLSNIIESDTVVVLKGF